MKESGEVDLYKRRPAFSADPRLVICIAFPAGFHPIGIHAWRCEIRVRHAGVLFADPWVEGEAEGMDFAFDVVVWIARLVNGHDLVADRFVPGASLACASAANSPIAYVVTRSIPASPVTHLSKGCLGVGVGKGAVIATMGAFCAAWLSIASVKSLNIFNISKAIGLNARTVAVVEDPIVFSIAFRKTSPRSSTHIPLSSSHDVFIGTASAH